jgi:hypothetical protein
MPVFPRVGSVLGFVGGLFVLLGGIVMAAIGAFISLFGIESRLFYVGIGIGLLILVFSVLLWAVPRLHLLWGVALIVLAFLSIPFAILGGFVIGFLLTLVGGIVGIVSRH